MSPERLKRQDKSDKSDMWAIGIIIYYILTNAFPFNGSSENVLYDQIMNLDLNFESLRNLYSSSLVDLL